MGGVGKAVVRPTRTGHSRRAIVLRLQPVGYAFLGIHCANIGIGRSPANSAQVAFIWKRAGPCVGSIPPLSAVEPRAARIDAGGCSVHHGLRRSPVAETESAPEAGISTPDGSMPEAVRNPVHASELPKWFLKGKVRQA